MAKEQARAMSERVEPLIVAATSYLPEPDLAVLMEASRRLGARVLPWQAEEELDASVLPSLLVAGLAPGARIVPNDIAHLLTHVFPRMPLLLLCTEPLVRSTMTAQAGRVVLVGPPLSASKIAARLRMLLASSEQEVVSGVHPTTGHWVEGDAPGMATREHRRPQYWVG